METDVKTKWGIARVVIRDHIPGACLVPNFNLSVRGNHLGGWPIFGFEGHLFEDPSH